jgi:acyl-CoA thioester hydrolase
MRTDRPDIGRFEGGAHLLAARVYYEDTDFTGVVYHANYLRYCERGRSEFLRVMAAAEGDRERDPGAFAVIRIELDFRAPARIHDELTVRTRFTGLIGPRLGFLQSVERDGRVLCGAKVIAVPIRPDGGPRKPTSAEQDLWRRYECRTEPE